MVGGGGGGGGGSGAGLMGWKAGPPMAGGGKALRNPEKRER
jgi:hypothetical protein